MHVVVRRQERPRVGRSGAAPGGPVARQGRARVHPADRGRQQGELRQSQAPAREQQPGGAQGVHAREGTRALRDANPAESLFAEHRGLAVPNRQPGHQNPI